MSMALEGVGFSFGIETAAINSAMSKISGKMGSVADSFSKLQASAVDGMFDSVQSGFSRVASGVKGLGGAMRSGISAVPGKIFEVGSASIGAGMNFAKKFGGPIMGFLAGGVSSGIDAIGTAMKNVFSGETIKGMTSGINLTTGFEDRLVGMGKSIRATGANFGYTGKKLDKFIGQATSMSISMKIGEEQAAKALRGWDEAGKDLKAFGFTSAANLAKFTEAFGVGADTLRNTSMQMRREFGMNDEQMRNVVGAMAKMGQETGDVAGAMNELPQVMTRMREQAGRMGVKLDSNKLADYATQTSALATGLFQMGQNSDEARAKAAEFTQHLLDSENQFAGMFAGVQNELPEFVKELAISTGDADKAFKLMESGPAGFIQGMTSMVAEARKNGKLTDDQMNFVKLRMEKVLGKDAASMMTNFFRGANQNTLNMMASTKEATNSLQAMAKEAFRSGMTMSESLGLATDQLMTKFRKLGKPAAREWLKDTRKEMKTFGEKVMEVGKDGGALGSFVSKMSEASSLGAQAFVPKALRPTTMVMGQMFDMMGPGMEAMGKMGINFTSLSGILTGVGTGFGLLATDMALHKEKTESWGDAAAKTVRKFGTSFADSISSVGDWLSTAADWFANFDISNIFSMGEEGEATSEFGKAMAEVKAKLGEWGKPEKWVEIASKFAKGFSSIWTFITENETVRSTLSGVMDWVSEFLLSLVEKIEWGKIFDMMKQGAAAGWDAIGGVSGIMGAMWDSTSVGKNYNLGIETATDSIENTVNATKGAFDTVKDFLGFGEEAKDTIRAIDEQGKETFGNSINTYAKQDMELTVEAFQDASTQIIEIINTLFMDVVGAMEGMMMQAQAGAQSVVENLKTIAALETALSGSDSVRNKHIKPAADRERDARISKLTSDEAIHSPMWYFGSDGYERLFNAKMDALIAAVYSIKVAQTGVSTSRASVPSMSTPPATSRAAFTSPRRG